MRIPKKYVRYMIAAVAVAWSVFQLYTGIFGLLPALQQRAIHLGFAGSLGFLLFPFKRKKLKMNDDGTMSGDISDDPKIADYILIDQLILSLFFGVCSGYIAYNYFALFSKIGAFATHEIVIAAALMFLLLELTRRATGLGLPIIALVFFVYSIFGQYFIGALRHGGYKFEHAIAYEMLGLEGVFGTCIAVSSSFIFLFILYAKFLQETGGGAVFIDLASALVGHVRGGPAKVAVVSSCLFGSISGSAVANVAGTGTFTIPMMKKTGYKAYFAGAVEAVASSGGQFMPPIMGSAAFLIAEILGIPYWNVALYALIPAILYYAAIFFMVDFEAGRENLQGLNKAELPKASDVLKRGWTSLLSPVVLVFLLTVMQWSPAKSAVWAIGITIVTALINPNTRHAVMPKKLLEILRDGALGAIETALACATVGVVVGSISQSGLGLKLSAILVGMAGGNLLILLLLTMLTSIILGMGLPTVACYLVLAVMVAPALVEIGVPPIAAHLFIFYFGIISNITPPVALASYVAAGIAKAPFVKTSLIAVKLGLSAFILPFMFVYNPALIMQGEALEIIQCGVTATVGIFALSIALERFFLTRTSKVETALFAVAAITMIIPEIITDIIGVTLFAILMVQHVSRARRQKVVQRI